MSEGAPAIVLVVAIAENGVIGAKGGLPWRLSTDLKRFKALTMGKPVVMGRATWDSIGRPLPGRANIVISRNRALEPEGARRVGSLDAALSAAREIANASGATEICVIGGGQIYEAALPQADRLYVTHVEASPQGDTHFPAIDPSLWTAVREERAGAGEKDSAATRFVVYERRT